MKLPFSLLFMFKSASFKKQFWLSFSYLKNTIQEEYQRRKTFYYIEKMQALTPFNTAKEICLVDGVSLSDTTVEKVMSRFDSPLVNYHFMDQKESVRVMLFQLLLAGHKAELITVFQNNTLVEFSYRFKLLNNYQKNGLSKLILAKYGCKEPVDLAQQFIACSKGTVLLQDVASEDLYFKFIDVHAYTN